MALVLALLTAVGGAGRWLSAGWDEWTWLCAGVAAGLLALGWLKADGRPKELDPEADDPTAPR